MIDDRTWRRTIGTATWVLMGCLLVGIPSAASAEASPIPVRLLPLARDLEAQLHLSYDATPPAYRDRIQYTLRVMEAWQRSGHTPRDETLLEGWLHDAIERSLPGRRAGLAPIPAFSDPAAAAEMHDVAPVADAPAQLDETRPTADAQRYELPPPPTVTSATPSDPVVKPEPTKVPPPERRPAHAPPVARPPAEIGRAVMLQPSEPTATERAAPREAVAATPVSPSPAEPASREALPVANARREAGAELNLNEYAARLVGHRLGVRRLEARMLELRSPTAEQLARMLGELETLHNQGALLAMYADLLPDELRRTYSTPVSAADALLMLHERVQGRQTWLAEQASIAPAPQQDREVALLKMLAAKLAQMGEATPSDK